MSGVTTQRPMVRLANGQSITPTDLRRRVEETRPNGIAEVRMIEVLIAQNFLDIDALEEFVAGAKRTGVGVAQYALLRRLCSETDIAKLLGLLHQAPLIDLSQFPADAEVGALLDPLQAHRFQAVPVGRREDGSIVVAVSDPSDAALKDELPLLLQTKLDLRVAPISQIRERLAVLYRAKDDLIDEQIAPISEDIRVGTSESDSAVVGMVNRIILQAQTERASDIHLEPYEQGSIVRYRVDGILSDIQRLPASLHEQIVARIKVMSQLRIDEKRFPQDGRCSIDVGRGDLDLRVATLPTVHGEQVVMRLLDPRTSSLSLADLGLSGSNLAQMQHATSRPWGAVIITGPTGSGKSTTLYSALHALNERSRKVITVEDPVEQRLTGVNQVAVSDTGKLNFANALRSILRNDPDVIMIGEIRDQETARIAIESALTGHLVLSSLHTNDAASAITRLMEMGVEPFLISNAIELIMAQRLVRRLCEVCRREWSADLGYLEAIQAPSWAIERARDEGSLTLYRANEGGCGHCSGRGYRGRTGTHEALHLTDDLKRAVVRGASAEEIAAMARADGLASLRDDCFSKVVEGTTSLEELARVVV